MSDINYETFFEEIKKFKKRQEEQKRRGYTTPICQDNFSKILIPS